MATIYHITTPDAWHRAQASGYYEADSLKTQGFIHCSNAQQVPRVANHLFRGISGLILLHIDTAHLRSRVVWENLDGGEEPFPHVYGPIEVEAISRVSSFEPAPDGSFDHHGEALGTK